MDLVQQNRVGEHPQEPTPCSLDFLLALAVLSFTLRVVFDAPAAELLEELLECVRPRGRTTSGASTSRTTDLVGRAGSFRPTGAARPAARFGRAGGAVAISTFFSLFGRLSSRKRPFWRRAVSYAANADASISRLYGRPASRRDPRFSRGAGVAAVQALSGCIK